MTNERRRMNGTVVSARMTKSVVVRVDYTVRHPLYGKVVHRSSKFMAHDPLGCRPGDQGRTRREPPALAQQALGRGEDRPARGRRSRFLLSRPPAEVRHDPARDRA